MGRELLGPCRGVKITSSKYVVFLTEHFLQWYKKNQIIFMHDNAPPHAANNTSVALAAVGMKG